MADIDQILAGGAGASTRADFSKLADIPSYYWKGRDEFAKNDVRDAFRGGVPVDENGQPDFAAMAKMLFQKGDVAGGSSLISAAAGVQDRAALAGLDRPQPPQSASPQPQIVSPPSISRTATATVAPPLNKGGAAVSPQGDQPGSIVGLVSGAGIPDEFAGPVIAQLSAMTKTDPNAPLDPSIAPRIQQVAQAAAQRIRTGQPPQASGLAPQAAPPAPATIATAPQVTPAPAQPPAGPSPAQVAAQNDPVLKRLTFLAASPNKETAAAAKIRLESYLKAQEATTEMKNAAASGQSLPAYQQSQADLAADQARGVERAKADVKEQQEYIDAGKAASQRLTTLNAITNVAANDKNVSFGFGADTELKVKMGLERLGFDFGDLSGSQLIQKMNASLASEMAKSLTGRPTQFEFKTFLANNPGLLLDKTGTLRLASIFSQLSKREYDLGKLARQNQDNWQNWDNVVEKYDAEKDHKIIDPVSKKPIYTNSIVAPGSGGTSQRSANSAPSGQPQFSSVADAKAAVAAGKLKSGDAFTDANGVTRYVP